jgi:hypothetical protein
LFTARPKLKVVGGLICLGMFKKKNKSIFLATLSSQKIIFSEHPARGK